MEWETRIEVISPLFTPRAHRESSLMLDLVLKGDLSV
jgi:hypothetical protein